MALPIFNNTLITKLFYNKGAGILQKRYAPFKNLKVDSSTELQDFTVASNKIDLVIDTPLDIETSYSYDDSVDLVITDQNNPPILVNSRFSPTSSTTYEIVDRKGDLDTNIYDQDKLKDQTSLVKKSNKITQVEYTGLSYGGNLKVGDYHFYFKYEDADGNQTDFIAESGQVVCHIGQINTPLSIRGGLLDENSEKCVNLILKNVDLDFDYIKVYFTRSTSDTSSNTIVTANIINTKFKISNIVNNQFVIKITGFEDISEIDLSELNIQYANFNSVKTQATVQNMKFMGNIDNDYEIFKTLESKSLYVYPTISTREEVGRLNHNYRSISPINEYEYFNTENIYYRLGYWNNEIYRFGIVYILNDYTLSPVFNIRGIKELETTTDWDSEIASKPLVIGDNYQINGGITNAKGVFKIKYSDTVQSDVYNTPIGIQINFHSDINNGGKLSDLVKGYFIVRQRRIPNVLAQGVGIATSSKAHIPTIKTSMYKPYLFNSFIYNNKLQPFYYGVDEVDVKKNALICPEATMRVPLYNNYFNTSEYKLVPYKTLVNKAFFPDQKYSEYHYYLDNITEYANPLESFISRLTLIEPSTELTKDGVHNYCSRAGTPEQAWKHVDPILGNVEDPTASPGASSEEWSTSSSKVRGEFNAFVGSESATIEQTTYYNIYNREYDFENSWKDYFQLRYNDASSFKAVSNRLEIPEIPQSTDESKLVVYRGDCYINTYTQKMQWGFVDPELPTNHRIVDPFTWYKNYRVHKTNIQVKDLGNNSAIEVISGVIKKATGLHQYWTIVLPDSAVTADEIVKDFIKDGYVLRIGGINYTVTQTPEGVIDGSFDLSPTLPDNPTGGYNYEIVSGTTLSYRKILPLFTYGGVVTNQPGSLDETCTVDRITTPDEKKYKKFSELNGTFGTDKLNRPDINAVGCGYWVTFPICSNINMAMRDLDFTHPEEEAIHRKKRGFYPLQPIDIQFNLPESTVLNTGISNPLSSKYYFELPDVPFIKTNFSNRIYNSNVFQDTAFKNAYRVFEAKNYQDYSMEYGALTKILEWKGKLVAVFEHGVSLIPINERAMMTNAQGDNVYINTATVLPKNPSVVSQTYGSVWKDSVIKTTNYIYGVDTVAKKIWRFSTSDEGVGFETISDLKIQKFLNDNIKIKEIDNKVVFNLKYVKTHYNAFKFDVIFTFKDSDTDINWSLCWNELLGKWTTQYSWFPSFSENINNIFYTFADKPISSDNPINYLWKHGFAGDETLINPIKPTHWYNEQHKFGFEFVVIGVQGIQKIFNNLKIISNKTSPEAFEYEVVGEGYDWFDNKKDVYNLGAQSATITDLPLNYTQFLTGNPSIKRLPYIWSGERITTSAGDNVTLIYDSKLAEYRVASFQLGKDIRKVGRIKGNMQYVEDSWDVQIQPTHFKYVYMKNGVLTWSNTQEMRIRDKYCKIRVTYDGTELALVQAIRTFFTISYA